jgi:hypothetical protein
MMARAMSWAKPKVLVSLSNQSRGEADGDADAGGNGEPLEPKSEAKRQALSNLQLK